MRDIRIWAASLETKLAQFFSLELDRFLRAESSILHVRGHMPGICLADSALRAMLGGKASLNIYFIRFHFIPLCPVYYLTLISSGIPSLFTVLSSSEKMLSSFC